MANEVQVTVISPKPRVVAFRPGFAAPWGHWPRLGCYPLRLGRCGALGAPRHA